MDRSVLNLDLLEEKLRKAEYMHDLCLKELVDAELKEKLTKISIRELRLKIEELQKRKELR